MRVRQDWTLAEAAYVLDTPLPAMKRMVERGPVRSDVVLRSGTRQRVLALRDLVYLRAAQALQDELTVKARADLYRALMASPQPAPQSISLGALQIDLAGYYADVERRVEGLDAVTRAVETGPDGEALIRGTRIAAHRIAALLEGGMTPEAVLADYPSLDAAQVAAARTYAGTHPKPGRPYPARTAKAAMREAALDDLDRFMGAPGR